MEESSENGTNYISLQPFIHQVSGHCSLLCLDEATICKPVADREQLFYETIPENLKSFVPSYYGIIKVRLIQDGDYITLSATTPANYKPKPSRNLKQLRVKRNGSIELDGLSGGVVFDESDVSASLNPWVLKCHKEYISSLTSRMEDLRGPLKFIVLENLTWRFSLPCILDLKMGTRQYTDNDSLTKKQSKMVKAITTTSAKLGVRITGMQVYQASSGRFLCRNKFYGRTLTTAGFKNAVRNFLHDGLRLRTDTLPPLIRRLEELHSVLTQLDSLRLYTTSLLLLYEGHCAINSNEPMSSRQFEMRLDAEREPRPARASSEDRLLSPPPAPAPSDHRCRSASCSPHDRKSFRPVEVVEEEPLTDVRIIDFAHSTHSSMDDKVVYSGPDSGFLLGLNTMIQLLKSILADSPE